MIQRRGGLRLSLKTREGLRVFRDVVRQEFQRDEAMEADVLGFVDDAHSSAAETVEDAVVRKCLVNQGVVRGHVLHILGCDKGQVNEDTSLCRRKMRMSGLCKVEMSAFMEGRGPHGNGANHFEPTRTGPVESVARGTAAASDAGCGSRAAESN